MEPLFFDPFFEEKPWGGQGLNKLYAKYPFDINIGESWELSSVLYRQTFVRKGRYAGTMLSELYKRNRELFGTDTMFFPFLIKFFDAKEMLPVMVHGGGLKDDETQAMAVYIIDAEPGAKAAVGTTLKNSLELFNAIAHHTLGDSLNYLDIQVGDSFMIPPGTPYTLGGGVLGYSITTPLCEICNVYDWNCYNDFNIDKVIDSFRYDFTPSPAVPTPVGQGKELLIRGELFSLERIEAQTAVTECTDKYFSVYTSLSPGQIEYAGKSEAFRAGDTFIVPAGFGEFSLTGGTLIKVGLPR
jgi:mannose-6-phosphate isomerase class I